MGNIDSIQPRKKEQEQEAVLEESAIFSCEDFKAEKFKFPSEEELVDESINRSVTTKKKQFLDRIKSIFNKKNLNKHRKKRLLVVIVLVLFVAIMMTVKFEVEHIIAQASQNANTLKNDLLEAENLVKNDNIEKALETSEKIKKEVKEMKLFAASYGQDIGYLQLINGKKTYLTEKEITLDAAYKIFYFSDRLSTDLNDIQKKGIFGDEKKGYLLNLSIVRIEAQKIIVDLKRGLKDLSSNLRRSQMAQNVELLSKIDSMEQKVGVLEPLFKDDLSWLSGEDGKEKNILIIFQNNSEPRGGTGGSLGSFGIARFKSGKLIKIDFGTNIYKLDNAFVKKEAVEAPIELTPFNNGRWSMKQAGYAVDGKEAFDKIRWFYQKETGNAADGVISFDTTAFGDLLKIMGPIEMPEYNKTITGENFKLELETEVQKSYFDKPGGEEENEPKKIISEIMPKFMDKLFSSMNDQKSSVKIFSSIAKSLNNKNILFNFDKHDFQNRLDEFNYTGRVKPAIGDYLYINASNIGGAKSNLLVKESANLTVKIADDGKINNLLNIERLHTGNGVFPDGRAQDFVRVLLPQNSSIENFNPVQGNFQIWHNMGYYKDGKYYYVKEEASKQTVCFWQSLEAGQKGIVEVSYKPKYSVDTTNNFSYEILFQHAPGAAAEDIALDIFYPSGFEPINVSNFNSTNNSIRLKLNLSSDKRVKINFKKQ